jgi:hypothetical protein
LMNDNIGYVRREASSLNPYGKKCLVAATHSNAVAEANLFSPL